MEKRVTKVEDMLEEFKKAQKEINNKYNDNKEDIANKEMQKELKEIDIKLKRSDLSITRLKEELATVPPKQKDLIEEYNKKIGEVENDQERQQNLSRKKEILEKMKEPKTNIKTNENKMEKELREAEDKVRAQLTQEEIKISKEIDNVELNRKMILMEMQNFKYQYKEENGVRIPINGEEYKALNDKYAEITEQIGDLKTAQKMCQEELQKFKEKDDKRMEQFGKAWNDLRPEKENKEAKKEVAKKEETKKEEAKKEETKKEDNEMQEKIDKAKQEMENSNRDYSNINLAAGAQVGTIHMPQNSDLNTFEKNNIITKTKEMMEKENRNYGNIHLNVDPDYIGENQIAKIESISISEGEGMIYAKTENGETTKISLKEALEGKKDNFKNLNVKELCKEISGNKIKGLLLGTKVNPAIIHALKDDPETVKAYITCLKEGKELPFELSHDLRNSQLGMFDKMKMWVHARAENKIPGTKVTFAGKFWNKNKALGTAEKEETKETKETNKHNVKKEYKVENKDNRIEQEAAKVMKETEKSMAETVKNIEEEKEK